MIRSVGTVLVLLVSALDAGAQSPPQAISTYDTGVGHGNPTVPTAQSELPNLLSGVVLTWDYYAPAKTVIFHALNNSGKDITGYSIVIRNKLPDGTMEKGGWTASGSEMLWAFVRMQLAKDATEERVRNDIFATGTTRDTNMTGFDEAPDFDVAVGTVFYADGSYDKQEEGVFKQMLADRQNRLLTMKKTNEIIQSALATSNDYPVAVAITELAKSAAETMASGNPETLYDHLKVGEVQMVIQHLKNLRRLSYSGPQKDKTERERLTQYLEEQEKEVELMTPHCHFEIEVKS